MSPDTFWVLGADVSTVQIDLALVPLKPRVRPRHWALPVPGGDVLRDGGRADAAATLVEATVSVLARTFPVVAYGVELPSGRTQKIDPRIAAVAFGTSIGIERGLPTRTAGWIVTAPEWKKAIGVGGNAAKQDVIDWLDQTHGICTDDDNLADSVGVAHAMKLRFQGSS